MIFYIMFVLMSFAEGKFNSFPETSKPIGDDCKKSYPVVIGNPVFFMKNDWTPICNGVLLPTSTATSYLYLENWCKDLHSSYKNKTKEIEFIKKKKENLEKMSLIKFTVIGFSAGVLSTLVLDKLYK
tara:strand:- start:74341 stop:74721 length:381 start_codon:yes stop_codon:yes gene_type:complete